MKRLALGGMVALSILSLPGFMPSRAPTGVPSPRVGIADATPLPGYGPAIQAMDTVVIQIVADADSVAAVPATVRVRPGQVVTWSCELGDWTVLFRSGQPFGDAAVGEGIRGNRGQGSSRAVRPDAAAGRYKYDILVQVQGGPPLRADPEIIVDPGEGGLP